MAEKTGRKASGRKLTKEQKAQVIELALKGVSSGEIALQMNIDILRVSGTVRSAKNIGALPPDSAPNAPVPSAASIPPVPSPAPPTRPASGGQAPPPSDDGYVWSQDPEGGFSHPAQAVKYLVERIAPQNDGIVGSHAKAPADDEVARAYGHGLYKVSKQIPGKLPETREVNVSRAFGESRWPRDTSQVPTPPRPGYPGRPWQRRMQMQGDEGDGGEHLPLPPRPMPHPPAIPQPQYESQMRGVEEFARRSVQGSESVAVTVIDKLAGLQEKTLERMESQATRGPDTYMRDFFTQQRDFEQRTATDERVKADERRDDERSREESRRNDERKHEEMRQDSERKRDEDRRREDEGRHQRWQDDQDKRHARDMERIKEERQMLLGLEDKKLNLIREESKGREDILRKEIENNRERVAEIQETSEARMEEMQTSVKVDLERGRSTMDREHEIRQKAQENEYALKREMLDIKGEVIKAEQASGQDDWTKVLGVLGDGVKDILGKIVDLKKFQMATPEDRAAEMAGKPAPMQQGDVQSIPAGAIPASPPPAPHPAPQASPTKEPGGNGHPPPAPAGGPGVLNIESIFQDSLREPIAQYILKEWSLTLTQGNDPAMFVNTFMEFMKDETPNGASGRKACAAFAQLMDNRGWPEMKQIIVPALPEDIRAPFDLPGAPAFYNAFRVMACESVRDYWQMYLAEKQRIQRERQAATQGQTTPPVSEQKEPPPQIEMEEQNATPPSEELVVIPEEPNATESKVDPGPTTAVASEEAPPAEKPPQEAGQGGQQPAA